ncbi:hypothetical protein [Streptomyces smaragdinus]|uniref:hypothetical protein n=1 Tax=Streptomyces smaragdinus TaxID=2585196 RepID=UPI001E433CF2|nr:hypothetical protein [Streptomyces smaragdinus]
MTQPAEPQSDESDGPTVPAQTRAPEPVAPEPVAPEPAAPEPAAPPPAAATAPPAHTGSVPLPPFVSEATRLLCAGVYLDSSFRRRVIEELVEQRQRTVAPSLGVDAVPVLAHALRCRQAEVLTGVGVGFTWLICFVLNAAADTDRWWVGWYALVCLFLWLARIAADRSSAVYTLDVRPGGRIARWRDRLALLVRLYARLQLTAYWALSVSLLSTEGDFVGLAVPLLLALPVWAHRAWVDRALREELAKPRFRQRPRAGLPGAHSRLAAAIDMEQYARLTVYDPFEPFVGYGHPYDPWSFAIELKRKKTLGDAEAPALTSRQVIDLILPKLGALRQSAAATSRDRLRQLEVEHLAYLPTSPRRGTAGYDEDNTNRHIAEAVDEGGEARRYFLRVRVGAWDENVVVSVLVRVHTQGGMLVLEVVPHVLFPVRAEFREVDRIVARGARSAGLRGFVRALVSSPTAVFAAGVSILRTCGSSSRAWLNDPEVLPGEGPVTSVRELGSADDVSLFQEMDISRYVKTIQDRIASGVTDALEASGYETERFTQQVFNIAEGGMFIGQMSGGAVAQGSGAQAGSGSGDGGGKQ